MLLMSKNYLQIDKVNMMYFGGYLGLENISLTMSKGQVVAVYAPKFNGKSNLSRVIVGLEKLSSGEIWLDNVRLDKTPMRDKQVSITAGKRSFVKSNSVYQACIYPLVIRNYPQEYIEERWNKVANYFEIMDIAHTKIFKLTEGQFNKVAIARCLIRESKLHIIDEINQGKNVDKDLLKTAIDFAKESGCTMLYTTDDWESLRYADNVVIMRQCTLIAKGTLQEIEKRKKSLIIELAMTPSGEIETGILTLGQSGYFIKTEIGELPTKQPIDNIYLNKKVVFVKTDTIKQVDNYYDMASEYNVVKFVEETK